MEMCQEYMEGWNSIKCRKRSSQGGGAPKVHEELHGQQKWMKE